MGRLVYLNCTLNNSSHIHSNYNGIHEQKQAKSPLLEEANLNEPGARCYTRRSLPCRGIIANMRKNMTHLRTVTEENQV